MTNPERDVVAKVKAYLAACSGANGPIVENWLHDLIKRCEQAEQERDTLKAESERLKNEAYQRFVADREHCKDCCCARSWKALGVTTNTGKSIPEHIEELVQKVAAHEQDIEAAWRDGFDAGWYATSYTRIDGLFSCFKASRKGTDNG